MQGKTPVSSDAPFRDVLDKILTARSFKPDVGRVLLLGAIPGHNMPAMAVVGAGYLTDLDPATMETIAASVFHGLKSSGFETVSLDLSGLPSDLVAHAVLALHLSSYRFDV
jgi:leucyl aminopeptidase